MSIDEIVALVAERFADVEVTVASEENGAPAVAWGDTFCTYVPGVHTGDADEPTDGAAPRMPFATSSRTTRASTPPPTWSARACTG